MGIVKWLRSLFAETDVRPHDYVHPPLSFPQLDLKNIQKRLQLQEEGAARGKTNLPAQQEEAFDDIENRIVTLIRGEVQLTEEKLSQQMRAYGDRQASLTIATRLNQLVASSDDTVSQFFTCVRQGKDRLFQIKQDFLEINQEYSHFKQAHGLMRPARFPRSKLLHRAIIAAFVLIETVLNGSLLAVGNAIGLVGGISEALIIALINVIIGLLAGAVCLRYFSHKNKFVKVVMVALVLGWLIFSLGFNLTVAHYRAALAGQFSSDASHIALSEMRTNPFGIQSVQGWLLLALGLGFNLGAAFDMWKMDDPYPGYGPITRRREVAQSDYVAEKQYIENDLVAIKDNAVSQLDQLSTEMEFKAEEYRNIDESRKSLVGMFVAHLTYLEQCCNQLLATYRQANISNRATPAPDHFNRRWMLNAPDRVPIPVRNADMFDRLKDSIEKIKDTRRKILEGFTSSMQEFRALDEIGLEAKAGH